MVADDTVEKGGVAPLLHVYAKVEIPSNLAVLQPPLGPAALYPHEPAVVYPAVAQPWREVRATAVRKGGSV